MFSKPMRRPYKTYPTRMRTMSYSTWHHLATRESGSRRLLPSNTESCPNSRVTTRLVPNPYESLTFSERTHREDPIEDETLEQTFERYEAEERHRRKQWNHQYGFEGVNASPAEKEAEAPRRRSYDARIEAFRRRPPCPGQNTPLISSIPTAPNSALVCLTATSQEPERASHVTYSTSNAATSTPVHPTTTSTEPRRPRPVIPSIPTAPVHLSNSH